MIAVAELKPMIGRPKREDETERANLKLNSQVRKVLKKQALIHGRSESSQVEQLVLEAEALQRVLAVHPDVSAAFLTSLNNEILKVVKEVKG